MSIAKYGQGQSFPHSFRKRYWLMSEVFTLNGKTSHFVPIIYCHTTWITSRMLYFSVPLRLSPPMWRYLLIFTGVYTKNYYLRTLEPFPLMDVKNMTEWQSCILLDCTFFTIYGKYVFFIRPRNDQILTRTLILFKDCHACPYNRWPDSLIGSHVLRLIHPPPVESFICWDTVS